ncbi:unnamed protein product [Staurois parvus]|uniref:Uncharacterized protein n=1 Tax=Staurois parvus TaxID=386267 RepID=A0ABN9G5J6_9NEOB|nr:unnamed protein product [Staurois parvus]
MIAVRGRCTLCGVEQRVNAGSGETRYSECKGPGRPDIVKAGSGETGYSESRVRGDQI